MMQMENESAARDARSRWGAISIKALGVLALIGVLALGFRAYLRPDMILELTNFILCL